jgi:hypothetical protein
MIETIAWALCDSFWVFDVILDCIVVNKLFKADDRVFGGLMLVCILSAIFAAYLGILAMLRSTKGVRSCDFVAWLLLGFPFGTVALDIIVLFVPLSKVFGERLWRAVGLADTALGNFLPSYLVTRKLMEVGLESTLLSILQLVLFIRASATHQSVGLLVVRKRRAPASTA